MKFDECVLDSFDEFERICWWRWRIEDEDLFWFYFRCSNSIL